VPNRILHERICVSETIAQLTADEERFFYRLIVQCDDYGRFDARAAVLRARCFPLQLDRYSDTDVNGYLADLEHAGLVRVYAVDGRAYLQVCTWDRYQQTRAKHSKFPPPPTTESAPAQLSEPASICNQMQSDASNGAHMSPYPEAESYPEPEANSRIENREAGGSIAADAAPPMAIAPEKVLPPKLVAAFAAVGFPKTMASKTEVDAARRLLQHGSPDEIAQCWQDIATCEYGDNWDQRNLSFVMLTRQNRFQNWQTWKNGGRAPPKNGPKNGHKANGTLGKQDFTSEELEAEMAAYRVKMELPPL
jgi:hypothetical protein